MPDTAAWPEPLPDTPNWVCIAQTNQYLADFAPYVPAVNALGQVAFQATLSEGGSGVFVGDGQRLYPLAEAQNPHLLDFYSHPVLDPQGAVSIYARNRQGQSGLWHWQAGLWRCLSAPSLSPGPLGPTGNACSQVAFRAWLPNQSQGIFCTALELEQPAHLVAQTGQHFSAFHGLPVMLEQGKVLFRASTEPGQEGIYAWTGTQIESLVTSGEHFCQLGHFPAANAQGELVFAGTLDSGVDALLLLRQGRLETLLDTASTPFVQIRGGLINGAGQVVFFARQAHSQLGVYALSGSAIKPLLGLGDRLWGASLTDLALNAVSFSDQNQLALRVILSDQRQLILRTEV